MPTKSLKQNKGEELLVDILKFIAEVKCANKKEKSNDKNWNCAFANI